jgi:four helix bundle protein
MKSEETKKRYQDIEGRTFNFSVRIIKMVNQLPPCTATFELGKQLINSATSVNSNVVQARSGISKKDFVNHMRIARKEAKETKRWIQMIVASRLTTQHKTQLLLNENEEIISILVTIVKNAEKK